MIDHAHQLDTTFIAVGSLISGDHTGYQILKETLDPSYRRTEAEIAEQGIAERATLDRGSARRGV